MIKRKTTHFIKSHLYLFLCFILPVTIMALYAWVRNIAPFGPQTIFTVDLGQQYVDFYAFFKRTFLHNPGAFFYSLNNGLGNETVGTFAYYLMSPFNFLLFFFKTQDFPAAIFLLLLLKIGCSSAAFSYFCKKIFNCSSAFLIGFACAYSLSGYLVANHFNLMWLDGLIMLPLITLGIVRLNKQKRPLLFIITFALMIIINYYIAYMIFIFAVLFFFTVLLAEKQKITVYLKQTVSFLISCLCCFGLSAFILLPTFYSLLNSKIKAGTPHVYFSFEYMPLDLITKLVPGSFNFTQMPHGLPNVFVSSMVIVLFALFFINKRFSVRRRMIVGTTSIFLIASLFIKPLDLFWHGFQFPVWYPYRFSFVVVFWLLEVSLLSLKEIKAISFSQFSLFAVIILVFLMSIYPFFRINHFNFLNLFLIAIFALFNLLALVVLLSPLKYERAFPYLISGIIVFEIIINLVISLNNISYLSQSEYQKPLMRNQEGAKMIKQHDRSLFRTDTNFYRTDDDPLVNGINGLSLFSSTANPNMTKFMGQQGPDESLGQFNYSNPNAKINTLMGIKYIEVSSQSAKGIRKRAVDLTNYQLISETKGIKLYENKNVLPIIFPANNVHQNEIISNADQINRKVKNESNSPANCFSAAVRAKPGELIATTIPYLKGFHVQVNGTNTKPEKWSHYFLAFRANAVVNRIKIVYHPPLFGIGLLLSALTLMGIGGLLIIKTVRRHC